MRIVLNKFQDFTSLLRTFSWNGTIEENLPVCCKYWRQRAGINWSKNPVKNKTQWTVEPRPNDCNSPTQHIATLLGATCCVRLAPACVAVCCDMLSCWLKFENGQIWANNTEKNVISDVWGTNKSEIIILTARWRDSRCISGCFKDYLRFLAGDLSHSRSVSRRVRPLYFFLGLRFRFQLINSSQLIVECPFLGVLCCCIRWGIRFHIFFGHI